MKEYLKMMAQTLPICATIFEYSNMKRARCIGPHYLASQHLRLEYSKYDNSNP
jgi:hypothetical protein